MLETRAIIMQLEGQYALVQSNQATGCEQCRGKGCGASKLSRLFCSKPRRFKAENSINARIGDEVVIAVAEGAVLRGTGVVYLLPLFLLVTGAMLGSSWGGSPGQQDGYAVAGALLGMVAGFMIARAIALRASHSYSHPCITGLWLEK